MFFISVEFLRIFTFLFVIVLRSLTFSSPCVQRALTVRSAFTIVRSEFTVCSRLPFTLRSACVDFSNVRVLLNLCWYSKNEHLSMMKTYIVFFKSLKCFYLLCRYKYSIFAIGAWIKDNAFFNIM